jgi:pyridinium-3,5-biscarboxylic acid mononucleotide sulfurtransferase
VTKDKTLISAKKVEDDLENLFRYFKQLKSVLVAFSGGVDSALLAWAAHETLGENMQAVLAVSPSLANYEKEAAIKFATDHSIPLTIIETSEMQKKGYLANEGDRCYYCKQSLFEKMEDLQKQVIKNSQYDWKIVYGVNQDDLGDYRPGLVAAKEHEVLTPYLDFKISKKQIREICRRNNLDVADKVAMPCLSSRIPHGEQVTIEKLSQIEQAEFFMKQLGFVEYRVRHHGDLARIEVTESEFEYLIRHKEQINQKFKNLNFLFVTIDITPFKSGSLNSTLKNVNTNGK